MGSSRSHVALGELATLDSLQLGDIDSGGTSQVPSFLVCETLIMATTVGY